MASQVTNYKCPACTGPLHFVGASGQLECDFCGSKYDVAQIEALYADKEAAAAAASEAAEAKAESDRQKVAEMEAQGWDTSDLTSDWGAEADGMKAYSCPSCGAELICDASTAATSCPYCGNPTVVPGQFSGALKPDFVIPFKLSREDAVAALKKHYKGKPLLPKAFTNGNPSGCLTVRQRAAWTTKAGSSTSIKAVTMRSPKPPIMTCAAAVLLPLRRCP